MSGGEIAGCTLQGWEMCACYKVCFGKSTLQCERGTKKYDEVCVVDMCVYASLVDQRSVIFTECQCACQHQCACVNGCIKIRVGCTTDTTGTAADMCLHNQCAMCAGADHSGAHHSVSAA